MCSVANTMRKEGSGGNRGELPFRSVGYLRAYAFRVRVVIAGHV